MILLAPPESDPAFASAVSEVASKYAGEHGMQFEQISILKPAELPPSLEKLIVLAPDPGVAALVAAAPEAQVITVGFSSETSSANLTSLALPGNNESQVAFIAGYIAAMSAEDWRAGILYTAASAFIVNDFEAGAEYFCGSCAPVSPPFIEYPANAQTDVQNWQTAADLLRSQSIKVVYLTPELENSGVGQYLSGFGVLLIGSGAPSADLASSWLVSIASNQTEMIQQLLPLALDGQTLQPVNSLSFANANPDLFSQSRQTNVQLVIEDLMTGYIQLPADQ